MFDGEFVGLWVCGSVGLWVCEVEKAEDVEMVEMVEKDIGARDWKLRLETGN